MYILQQKEVRGSGSWPRRGPESFGSVLNLMRMESCVLAMAGLLEEDDGLHEDPVADLPSHSRLSIPYFEKYHRMAQLWITLAAKNTLSCEANMARFSLIFLRR